MTLLTQTLKSRMRFPQLCEDFYPDWCLLKRSSVFPYFELRDKSLLICVGFAQALKVRDLPMLEEWLLKVECAIGIALLELPNNVL